MSPARPRSTSSPRRFVGRVTGVVSALALASALTGAGVTGASAASPPAAGPRFGVGTQSAVVGAGTRCTLGEIMLTAGQVANGLPADGQLVSIGSNTDLYQLLGTEYGGDGQTTFGLPNLASAAPSGLTYSICAQGVFPDPSHPGKPRPPVKLSTTHRFGVGTQLALPGTGRTCTLGEIILSAGGVANGIPANGQLLSINANGGLYLLYGNRYGGDGKTTFAVPNLGSAAPSGLTYTYCPNGIFPSASPTAGIPHPRGRLTTTHRFGVGTQTAVAGKGRPCTIGGVTLTAGSTANGVPSNGQLVTIASNPALFSLLGTSYGGGGKVHFGYPTLGRAAPSGLTYALCTRGVFPARM